MNTALRASILTVAAALFLHGAASSQRDRIALTDGTVIADVTVTSFDLRNVEFQRRGSKDTRSTDVVADLEVAKVKEAYRSAYAAIGTPEGPGTFLRDCRKQTDPFLKQFGYVEAARLFLDEGQINEGFLVLEELATECPDSGFLPMLYREKLDYYLSEGKDKAGDAMSVAQSYARASQTQGFPPGFTVEARFYETMAKAASGGLEPDRLRAQLRSLLNDASGFPNVADRCRLQIGNSLRAEKNFDEAQKEYEQLLDRPGATAGVRAGAWLGLGHCAFSKASSAEPEGFRQALLAFLRVYVETPDAPPATIAEALFMGAQAAQKWGGPDSAQIRNTLGYRLQRDHPDSPWNRR